MGYGTTETHYVPGSLVQVPVKSLADNCGCGHNVGDSFDISMHDTPGICGLLYHDIFPWIMALQLDWNNPWGAPKAMELECMDRRNLVKIELKRAVEAV